MRHDPVLLWLFMLLRLASLTYALASPSKKQLTHICHPECNARAVHAAGGYICTMHSGWKPEWNWTSPPFIGRASWPFHTKLSRSPTMLRLTYLISCSNTISKKRTYECWGRKWSVEISPQWNEQPFYGPLVQENRVRWCSHKGQTYWNNHWTFINLYGTITRASFSLPSTKLDKSAGPNGIYMESLSVCWY